MHFLSKMELLLWLKAQTAINMLSMFCDELKSIITKIYSKQNCNTAC